MNARDVEKAAADVDRSLHRARRCLIAAAVVAAIAVAVAPSSRAFAAALAVGAAVQLAAAVILWLCRRERIERLALDPSAYTIPAVALFGARVCALRERRRLAAFIQAVVHERGHPLELHLVVRAGRCAQLLEDVARELASPAASPPDPAPRASAATTGPLASYGVALPAARASSSALRALADGQS